jgi:uncharacterized membrane protein (UPF0127 family)
MAARTMTAHFLAPAALCTAMAAGCGQPAAVDGGPWNMDIAGKPFKLKLSCGDATRERGLGGITDIPADGGMIFAFTDSKPRVFWMKDCVTDMDIIFLDPAGWVTAIYTMTKEPLRAADEPMANYEARLRRYSSLAPAQFIIELRAGRAKELGLKTQQKIELDREALKAAAK